MLLTELNVAAVVRLYNERKATDGMDGCHAAATAPLKGPLFVIGKRDGDGRRKDRDR